MSLADPYLKTSRAKEHIESLKDAIKAFYESNPCRFVREDDIENRTQIVRLKLANVPDKVSLIAGDIFYNLRSALDQLVWNLAKLTTRYPEETFFPILETRNDTLFRRRTKGVLAEAAAIIKSLQPYNGGHPHDHLLWLLNKLCNIDKHMRIPVHSVAATVWWDTPPQFAAIRFDDDLIMRIPFSLKGKVGLNPRVTNYSVTVGDMYWGVEADFERIEEINEFVTNRVIPRFARFFK